MRSWLTWLVGFVIHNLTPAFGEKFLWRHHGMSLHWEEPNALPEQVFQIKNNQSANQEHENASRTSPGLFGGVFVKLVGNRIPASDLWKRAGSPTQPGLGLSAPLPALGPFLWGGHYAALKQRDRKRLRPPAGGRRINHRKKRVRWPLPLASRRRSEL
jgi:hypothetical protein